ncbi:hypothetical protein D3C78_1323990 [compost metagenome]
MIIHVHSCNTNLHLITDAVDLRCPLANQCHMLFMEMVIIIRHRTKSNQTLYRVLKLNKHPKASYATNNAREFLPNLIQHKLCLLELFRIALCINSNAFTLRRLLRNIMHTTH